MTSEDLRSESEPAVVALDYTKASLARLSDAMLGGHDHYEVDRAAMRQVMAIAPDFPSMAVEHRAWMMRVIRFLAAGRGIDQFLDLGSGLPTSENTHEVAQKYNPDAQVVYVDNDPVVQVHGRALLEENELTHVSGADLTKPEVALTDEVITRQLDFGRPMGLILCSIVHHIDDFERARHIVRAYVDALAPGSYLLLTHQFDPADGSDGSQLAQKLEARFQGTGFGSVYRGREEIESFFEGLEMIPPGLGPLHKWWPDGPRLSGLSALSETVLGGVARKP
ncbi:SAM-dependent methyltransferase [Amycolatopsis sp. H20-H5]|uniref:SAM-dependent methyltransferase n=1 Tax=Amycolatopsis sp. H20-H5 TaxID=3046309 RepID=UPI002DBFA755|nr:SAM-dependent methyltransferase [Amycolatopsis sp. H20-H5]MEC3978473.1 SAM-dependent methyltransferase [Amycolatopsis sp. H20-H5]